MDIVRRYSLTDMEAAFSQALVLIHTGHFQILQISGIDFDMVLRIERRDKLIDVSAEITTTQCLPIGPAITSENSQQKDDTIEQNWEPPQLRESA